MYLLKTANNEVHSIGNPVVRTHDKLIPNSASHRDIVDDNIQVQVQQAYRTQFAQSRQWASD